VLVLVAGYYHEYSTYSATFYTYQESCFVMVMTRSNLGWYMFGFTQGFFVYCIVKERATYQEVLGLGWVSLATGAII
jgi:hypothetical protein